MTKIAGTIKIFSLWLILFISKINNISKKLARELSTILTRPSGYGHGAECQFMVFCKTKTGNLLTKVAVGLDGKHQVTLHPGD
jgi:hypothetical protein